jgi:nucleoid DNA-binding protein
MTLTKAAIVERMTDELGLTKSKSTEVVESLLELIKSSLESPVMTSLSQASASSV